jgi:ABC-2 type transport system permease protein
MITRLAAQVVKELLSLVRDPRSRFVLIGPPMLQLFIFSFAATLDVTNVSIAVLNEDGGRWSQELIQRVQGAGFVGELTVVATPAELSNRIDQRRAIAAIRFPADFSRDIGSGRPARAQVILDGRRANSSQITFAYLSTIASGLGAELLQTDSGGNRAAPTIALRHWFNPNLIYRWFIVPSLSGILAMLIALLVTSLSIARERELGTFEQLLVSPAQPIEIIIGKTIPALLIGTLLGTVMILAGVFVFQIPFTGSALMLFGSLMLFILSMVGIGLMVSSICQTQQQAILGTFSVAVPIVLISGFTTPVENMPDWLQFIAQASPMKYYLIIVRGSFLKSMPSADIFANVWPLVVIALVTLGSAIILVRRTLN